MSARFTPVILLVSAVALLAALPGVSGGAAMPPAITVSGFQTPESVLYDPTADLYLVANINGNPAGTDDNGFISRVTPAGQVQTLKWIDGASAAVTLNAPKGMAIAGDTLYVADITAVRMFDRTTGQAKGSVNVPGATFLNDAAAGPDGSIYVTDSGLNPDFSPNGTDAVYRIKDGALSTGETTRVRSSAAPRPIARPTATVRSPWPSTIPATSPRRAPSARRMPISRVRRETAYETTP